MSELSSYRSHDADRVRVKQDGDPEGIFTWVKLPGGGIRLYASRELPDVAWGQREHLSRGVVWHLDANMTNMLIVDRPTAAEALRWVLERWAREDAEEAARLAALDSGKQRAIGRLCPGGIPESGRDAGLARQAREPGTCGLAGR